MKNIIVTGSSGFIGSNLVNKLSQLDVNLGLFARSDISLTNSFANRSFMIRDNLSFDSLDMMFSEITNPDVIFHFAGGSSVGCSYKDPRMDYLKSVDSTSILFEYIRLNKIITKVIVASSASVYGSNHYSPICEDAAHNPSSPYGYHCAMKEGITNMYSENFGITTVIARIFSACGNGLKKQLLWDLCNKLLVNDHIKLGGTGKEIRDWVPIELCVDALLMIANTNISPFKVVNIGSGSEMSVDEMVETITRSWNELSGTNKTFEFNNLNRTGNPKYLVANVSRLQSIFNFNIPDNRLVAQNYVKWFLNE